MSLESREGWGSVSGPITIRLISLDLSFTPDLHVFSIQKGLLQCYIVAVFYIYLVMIKLNSA